MTSQEEFTDFAVASAPRLRRAAFLLCGDWHTTEDVAQTALAKVFVSWRKVRRQDAVYAYATRTLVNAPAFFWGGVSAALLPGALNSSTAESFYLPDRRCQHGRSNPARGTR